MEGASLNVINEVRNPLWLLGCLLESGDEVPSNFSDTIPEGYQAE